MPHDESLHTPAISSHAHWGASELALWNSLRQASHHFAQGTASTRCVDG